MPASQDPIRKLSHWRGCVRWHGSYFTTRQPVWVCSGSGPTKLTVSTTSPVIPQLLTCERTSIGAA